MTNQHDSFNYKARENLLVKLLQRLIKEYKSLLDYSRKIKPFKIIEIIQFSHIPGETRFAIQLTNKDCVLKLTAAEIISEGYNLNNFNEFHAEMIQQAAQGRLGEFFQLSEKNQPFYKIISKTYDRKIKKLVFSIQDKDQIRFNYTAQELSHNKKILENMSIADVYDVGFTQGNETILKEKKMLYLAKKEY